MVEESTQTEIEKCNFKEVLNDIDFVGIHYLEGKFDISFPLGYRLPHNIPDKDNYKEYRNYENQKRKDILTLMTVMRQFKNTYVAPNATENNIDNNENFPLYAYLEVYSYYKRHGYYVPRETISKKTTSGKINWHRTIKQIEPAVNNGNVVYLETIRNKINYNENELIAIINRYCVYQSFLKIGCLFSGKMVKKENLKVSKTVCKRLLNNKIKSTFDTDLRKLFINMKRILEAESNDNGTQEYFYGTTSFHSVWEAMVDSYFGENKSIKQKYNPHLRWHESKEVRISGQSSTLRPDTIAFLKQGNNENVFILDSKYYKGSVNLEDGNLPLAESVPKQLVYASHAINNCKNKPENVYNAFIMPNDLSGSEKATKSDKITAEYYGYVKPEWLSENDFKDKDKPYNRIQGIKIDTKDLMENYSRRNNTDFEAILELIQKEADSNKY